MYNGVQKGEPRLRTYTGHDDVRLNNAKIKTDRAQTISIENTEKNTYQIICVNYHKRMSKSRPHLRHHVGKNYTLA